MGLSALPAAAPNLLLEASPRRREAGALFAQGASKYQVLSYIFV